MLAQPVEQDVGQAVGLVEVREVARGGQRLEAAVRDLRRGGAAVLERDHPVALAPDDERGHRAEQVEAVAGRDVLAAGIDHRAQRLQEGLAGAGPLQRAQGADDLAQVDGLSVAALVELAAAVSIAPERAPFEAAHRPAEAPGRAAIRSSGPTSRPRPPEEIRARRSTRSGNCQKYCIAMPPPSEWPTIVARSTPIAESRSRITAAWAPIE